MATPDSITHHEAVNLFVDRATSARSDFRLTPANAPAVAALCRDLDGVPLAIELAAARIRALSPQEVRDSLAERVEVLNLGYRDADERHQSLHACVEWSFELCSQPEQTFWARSSVFAGGFDLEAATAVCGADDLPAGEILDLVSALVDQSVLLAEETANGSTRYRMLGEIRQFGLEQAQKDGELPGMQERHATWCAELVARFDDDACGPRQADWLRVLRLEHANLRAALEHFTGSAEATAPGLTMARGLDLYWSASGLLDEARHWLDVGLASGSGTPPQRAVAQAVAARFAILQNDRVRAGQLLDEGTGLAACRRGHPRPRVAAGTDRHARGLGGDPYGSSRSGRLRRGPVAGRVRPPRRAAGALRRRGLSWLRGQQ